MKKILIIDDEKILRESQALYLEDLAYEILQAENGKIGLEIFFSEKPDLVIVDLRMPEVDGLDVLKGIKDSYTNIPVIVISGTGNIKDVVDALKLGAWDFLTKPIIDLSLLKIAVEKALEKSALLIENQNYKNNLEKLVKERTTELRTVKLGIDKADEIIFMTDIDGNITYANPKFEKVYGFSQKETLGKTPRIIKSGLYPKKKYEEIWEKILNKKIIQDEIINKDKDGNEIYIDRSINPILDETNNIIGFLSIQRDITKQKEIERNLTKSEKHYRLLAENIGDVIWQTDANYNTIFVSPSIYELLGYTQEEFLKISQVDFVNQLVVSASENDIPKLVNHSLSNSKSNPEIPLTELRLRKKDGSIIWVERRISILKDKDNNFTGIIAASRNITKRKIAEEALNKYYKRLSNLHTLQYKIISSSSKNEIAETVLCNISQLIECNQVSIVFFNKKELECQEYWELNAKKSNIEFKNNQYYLDFYIGSDMKQGSIELIDLKKTNIKCEQFKQLTKKELRCTMAIPLLGEQELLGAIYISSNTKNFFHSAQYEIALEIMDQTAISIHQLKLLEDTKKQALELETKVIARTSQLQEANKELESFSYSVSHDLRAPLRSINGFSDILLEDYSKELDQDGKEYLQRIKNAANRMATLIDDLLDLSRITQKKLAYTKFNISKMVEYILMVLKQKDTTRKVNLKIQKDISIIADERFIQIALENLLGNAWKFTSKIENAELEFGVLEKDKGPVYYIKDNGAGFAQDRAESMFNVFQRGHHEKEFEGTGIGLAIVRRIISRHKGRIWAESEINKGSTFYFCIKDKSV